MTPTKAKTPTAGTRRGLLGDTPCEGIDVNLSTTADAPATMAALCRRQAGQLVCIKTPDAAWLEVPIAEFVAEADGHHWTNPTEVAEVVEVSVWLQSRALQ